MKNPLRFLSVVTPVVLAVALASCASPTPQSRIAARPGVFEKLSDKDKELVSRGEIAQGMGQDAVSLAWGSPSRALEGLRGGKDTERWDYLGRRSQVTNSFFVGHSTGFFGGRHGRFSRRHGFSSFGGGFGPTVISVPFRKATVWFVEGRVDEWERVR